jgi:hypothetical protein
LKAILRGAGTADGRGGAVAVADALDRQQDAVQGGDFFVAAAEPDVVARSKSPARTWPRVWSAR